MHYCNGRPAANGDKVVQLQWYGADDVRIAGFGVLYDAKPGTDYCNGNIAPIQQPVASACLIDCLHVDDLVVLLKEKGIDKRPESDAAR